MKIKHTFGQLVKTEKLTDSYAIQIVPVLAQGCPLYLKLIRFARTSKHARFAVLFLLSDELDLTMPFRCHAAAVLYIYVLISA